MARLTRAIADAERLITTATADLVSSEQTLEDALTVAGSCHRHYETAPDFRQTADQPGVLSEVHHRH